MTHFHVTTSHRIIYVVRRFVPSDFHPSATAHECACEEGEIELYHEGIEAGAIGEECVCSDCERQRNGRFQLWCEQQEKAGVHVE